MCGIAGSINFAPPLFYFSVRKHSKFASLINLELRRRIYNHFNQLN